MLRSRFCLACRIPARCRSSPDHLVYSAHPDLTPETGKAHGRQIVPKEWIESFNKAEPVSEDRTFDMLAAAHALRDFCAKA